jgi:hypothetical protein
MTNLEAETLVKNIQTQSHSPTTGSVYMPSYRFGIFMRLTSGATSSTSYKSKKSALDYVSREQHKGSSYVVFSRKLNNFKVVAYN